MCRDDDLVGPVLMQRVFDRLQRIGVDDRPARRDPGLVEKVERPPEAPFRRRTALVLVDDEARARGVLRADDGDADRPLGGALANRVEERAPDDRLVRDDEDVPRARSRRSAPRRRRFPQGTISSIGAGFRPSSTGLPFSTACRAPRTPYS
jgi:hypothetical protein